MSIRTSQLFAILTLATLMFVSGGLANSRSQQNAARKPSSRHAKKAAHRQFGEISEKKSQPLVEPIQDNDRENGIEDVRGREDWFLFQRKYPFDFIPDDARKRAFELRPAELLSPEVVSWQLIGPTPTTSAFPSNWGVTSGRINSVAISPANSQIVLVGGATGGIWRSTNGGTSFSPTSDSQTDLAVQTIAFSASNSAIVYAGMGDADGGYLGTGVLKSTDSGQTWIRINNSTLPSPGRIAKIEVDPTNPNRVYVAQFSQLVGNTQFSSGFYLSSDGGVSWTMTLPGLPRDLVINPANAQTLYLAMSRVDDGVNLPGLYRSTNGGSTWLRIYTTPYDLNATYDVAVAVTPVNSQVIYVYTGGVLAGSFETRVELSTNGGSTWTNRGSGTLDRGQFGYNTYIYVDPTNANTVYAGTRDVFKSVNGAVSWTNLTNNFNTSGQYTPNLSNTHPDQHSFAFLAGSSSTFYIGNDGGVWKTTNSGTSFSNFNTSLSLTMFVGYTIHPTNATISYGGTQDNGSQKRLTTPGQWREFISGDGGNCVINVPSPSTIFSTYVYGTIFRFTNDGDTFDATVGSNTTFGESNTSPRIAFYAPFTGNGINSNLYFGTWRLFISTNLGNSWTAPAGTFDLTKGTANGPDVLSAIGVSRSNTNVIYTGSAQGRAMVSTTSGTSWTDITTGLPNRFIASITVDPGNAAKAYLTVSGFNTGHVFLTTNSGASWTNISGNLPDIPVNTLLIDPLNANTLYVGTDIGVFQSTSGGGTWAGFNGGLPPVVVSRLVAQSSGLTQAATYGRGAFELTNGGTTTRTLTVASSNPASGVSITVSPNDNNGQGNGVTQFTRVYNDSTMVNLTAPATAGANTFQKWQRDGVDFAVTTSTNVTMDADHTMTAVYVPPTTRTLTVASSNPASGVSITVTPNDNNGQGNGVTQFIRTYNLNTVVNLTAPPTAGGNTFLKWQRDGLDFAVTTATSVTMDVDHTMTAVYSVPGETVLLNETFAAGIPATWSIVDGGSGGGTAATWTTTNPGGRSIGGTFFTAPFAIVDSDFAGVNATQDEQLITPALNASGCTGRVVVEFGNQFRWFDVSPDEVADVDVSTNGGSTWANVHRMQGTDNGYPIAVRKTIDITSAIGSNRSNLKIRFHYYNANFEWWWAIDNVKVKCVSGPPHNGSTTGIFRPSNGALYLKNSNTTGFADLVLTYGSAGDYPVAGDWNGDGVDTIGVYRNGTFYLRNSNTIGFADIVVQYGQPGDQPVVGDWDGDGVDTIGVFRNGTFLLRNSNTPGPADIIFGLGGPGDVGIAGDWDGDGLDTTGVYRPSNGALYLKFSNTTGFADLVLTYGSPGDKPIVGDWDGDGIDTIGIYRVDTFFLRNTNTNGFADIIFTLGSNGDLPISGDWDGLP